MIKSFRDLEIYRESFDLSLQIYRLTHKIPKKEQFELASQLRRASYSVPSNIAEGWAKRKNIKEFSHYLDISCGSCNEIQVFLELIKQLNYIDGDVCDKYIEKYDGLAAKIQLLQKRWKNY